ncbi:tetratricopeptide repeat protein [Thiospirillum jenense]|uniref:Tetratricopeptide repeat protein n=1 Tax=Thiospirillum jenense TaxID=1653858 RepID=A0A839HHX9_9GAMM|nr:tetratricopeptide repeat protein [Thiospirillum jenense]MBB1125762.1 tetratricopeptide repeat protein [Thiospirillum jenense]
MMHYRLFLPAAACLLTAQVTLAATAPPPSATTAAAPAREFTTDLLYQVLVAEIAVQRDQPLTAFSYYFAAAERARNAELAELATRAAITAEAQGEAELAVNYWLQLSPESLSAQQLAAYVAIKAERLETALDHLRTVVALAKTPQQGYQTAARLVARVGDPARRVDLMRTLIADHPSDADGQLALAAIAAGAGQLDVARTHAEQAAALRPNWSRPPQLLAQLFIDNDRPAEARAVLERYFAGGYDDLDLRLLYAQLLIEAEDFTAARQTFATILQQRPNAENVLLAAALLSLQLKDYPAARRYFLQLKTNGQQVDEALFLLGQVEEAAGDNPAALNWYQQVGGDKKIDAQLRTAAIAANGGDLTRAREVLQQLRHQFPDNQSRFYLAEGELLTEAKQLELAREVYSQGLTAAPDDIDLLYARALLAARMQQVALLEQDLRRVLKLNPDHADALNALGYTLADQTNRFNEARAFIERALELEPDEPAILDSMGWLLYRTGQIAQAEPYLRKALKLFDDGEIAAHLGELLWTTGRRDEAQSIWDHARQQAPDHEYLLRTMQRYLGASLPPIKSNSPAPK